MDRGALHLAPLLIVGAERDRTVPASLSKKQYEKYGDSEAQTDYLEFRRSSLREQGVSA